MSIIRYLRAIAALSIFALFAAAAVDTNASVFFHGMFVDANTSANVSLPSIDPTLSLTGFATTYGNDSIKVEVLSKSQMSSLTMTTPEKFSQTWNNTMGVAKILPALNGSWKVSIVVWESDGHKSLITLTPQNSTKKFPAQ